jgi:hypothetical protein
VLYQLSYASNSNLTQATFAILTGDYSFKQQPRSLGADQSTPPRARRAVCIEV